MELMKDYELSDDERLYKKAKEKARNIRGFYINLTCYCVVIPILIFVNLTYSPEFYWFFFSMFGWGTGLLFHASEAFNWNPLFSKKWEERKIKELLDKENRKSQHTNNKD
jgi:hypothetical protein